MGKKLRMFGRPQSESKSDGDFTSLDEGQLEKLKAALVTEAVAAGSVKVGG